MSDYDWQDANGLMAPVKHQVRKQYGKLVEKVQQIFVRHVEKSD